MIEIFHANIIKDKNSHRVVLNIKEGRDREGDIGSTVSTRS